MYHESAGLGAFSTLRRGFAQAVQSWQPPAPRERVPRTPKITEDIVNDYIKENPDIVSNYLRNERAMKAQCLLLVEPQP